MLKPATHEPALGVENPCVETRTLKDLHMSVDLLDPTPRRPVVGGPVEQHGRSVANLLLLSLASLPLEDRQVALFVSNNELEMGGKPLVLEPSCDAYPVNEVLRGALE